MPKHSVKDWQTERSSVERELRAATKQELPQAQKAAKLLGGALQAPIPLPIPGLDWQHLLIPCKKVSKTLRQYPRKAGTPVKKPLGEPT